jgi:hypothetical protein
VQPQRHAHVLAEREEEGLPVGGIVLQHLLQQLVVLDMGKIPTCGAAHACGRTRPTVATLGLAPTSQKLCIKSMTVERVSEGKIVEHWRVTGELDI